MSGTSFKKDFVAPVLVLTIICIVISAALAVTNMITEPIIEETEARNAEAARREVMPEADGFELVEADGLPETVTEVYRATNGVGYVFMLTCDGYGGKDTLNLICGIDSDGLIVATKVLSHSETAGLGSKVADEPFESQFIGKDASLEGVEAISGASRSSGYYINGIKDAFTAFEIVKGAE